MSISDRATAAISSATLVDHEVITKDNNSLVIDRNKIRHSKSAVNTSLVQESKKELPPKNVYFDRRKDITIV